MSATATASRNGRKNAEKPASDAPIAETPVTETETPAVTETTTTRAKERNTFSLADAVKLANAYAADGIAGARKAFPELSDKDLAKKLAKIGVLALSAEETTLVDNFVAELAAFSQPALAVKYLKSALAKAFPKSQSETAATE
jgi:hypothetical protein